MEPSTNSSATAPWTRKTSSTPRKNRSFRRNQFGASVGGPIQRRRCSTLVTTKGCVSIWVLLSPPTFLGFGAGGEPLFSRPTPGGPNGCATFHTIMDPPAAGGSQHPGRSIRMLRHFLPLWPLPNGRIICPYDTGCVPGAGDTGKYNFAGYQITPENFATVRLDRKLTDKNTLWGTFLIDRQSQTQNDSLGDLATSRFINRQTWTIEDTHTFSANLINVLRVGFNGRT